MNWTRRTDFLLQYTVEMRWKMIQNSWNKFLSQISLHVPVLCLFTSKTIGYVDQHVQMNYTNSLTTVLLSLFSALYQKKKMLFLTFSITKKWQMHRRKTLYSTMRFEEFENTQRIRALIRMVLPRHKLSLCVTSWTKTTERVVWGEDVKLNGLLAHLIWRPYTTISGVIWG